MSSSSSTCRHRRRCPVNDVSSNPELDEFFNSLISNAEESQSSSTYFQFDSSTSMLQSEEQSEEQYEEQSDGQSEEQSEEQSDEESQQQSDHQYEQLNSQDYAAVWPLVSIPMEPNRDNTGYQVFDRSHIINKQLLTRKRFFYKLLIVLILSHLMVAVERLGRRYLT